MCYYFIILYFKFIHSVIDRRKIPNRSILNYYSLSFGLINKQLYAFTIFK